MHKLTPDFHVAPQITVEDVPALKHAGVSDVICNRPDSEVMPDQHSATLRAAVQAAGMRFHDNPVSNAGLTEANVALQGKVVAEADGPVFAYCRSGTRSTIVWALSQAGHVPTDALITAAAAGGYDLTGLRAQLDALAATKS